MRDELYRKYLLLLLMLILAFNYVDRLALGLVLEDIKASFHLSDTQLGMLTGIAFALFYSTMGIPIARWADRGNRVTVITVSVALWSAAVALCGFVSSFPQLLLARMGVAVGEAGCMPPAFSMIADYFSRLERPRAVAVYMLGSPLSMLIGYFLAGWLNEQYGWRIMFILLALPGLGLAALARLTLREPRRWPVRSLTRKVTPAVPTSPPANHFTMTAVYMALWNNVTFRYLWLCFSVTSFFGRGVLQWQPTFFIRSFGMQTGELGAWFTFIFGVGGLFGTYLGGRLAFRYAAGNEALQLKAMGWIGALFSVLTAAVFLCTNKFLALTLTFVTAVGSGLTAGPLFATLQSVVPERMRAVSIALVNLFANLIGMGLGPLAVGLLSDFFRPWFHDESLRYALLTFCPVGIWGSWYLILGAKTVVRDIEAANPAPTAAT